MKKYINKLINPDRLYRMEDVITSLCPIPETAGVYVWYFRDIPKPLPKLDFNTFDGCSLLYVGICPRSNKSSTNRNIRRRILEHYGKTTAEGSTLRFTLGVLLGLPLFLKGASKHGSKTFSKKGEQDLSDWMS
ncbi:MAG: GIY-YIG nuclease family protein, partial [Gammaproteobacteria bacterium]